jgi:hypothetical protein
MLTLADLISRISFLSAMPAVLGILFTGTILVVSREWHLDVLALMLQYFCVVLLLTRLVQVEVAAVKGLIGWMICMVFYLTERRAGEVERRSTDESAQTSIQTRRWMMSARASFSLLAALMTTVVAYTAALRIPLPEIPADISLACYLLVGLGLLLVGISQSPIHIAMGLLTFLSGFDLFFVALEPSLAVAGLLGLVSFLVALTTSFLRATELSIVVEGESR